MTDNLKPPMRTASLTSFAAVFAAVFLLTVVTVTLITFILPESFASTARIKVESSPASMPSSPAAQGSSASHSTPNFVETACEIIRSEIVLKKVVERLDLNAAWGKKYTSGERLKTSESLQLLKARLEVRPVRNTSLIEIRAFSDTPSEAANLANTVTDAYVQYVRASSDGTRSEVVDTAIPGLRPVRPNKPLNIIIGIVTGAILGLACGACAAWLARRAQFAGS